MNEQEVRKLYTALLNKGYSLDDLGDEKIFMQQMSNPDNRRELYNWVSSRKDFKIGDYDSYESRLAGVPATQANTNGGTPVTTARNQAKEAAGTAATPANDRGTVIAQDGYIYTQAGLDSLENSAVAVNSGQAPTVKQPEKAAVHKTSVQPSRQQPAPAQPQPGKTVNTDKRLSPWQKRETGQPASLSPWQKRDSRQPQPGMSYGAPFRNDLTIAEHVEIERQNNYAVRQMEQFNREQKVYRERRQRPIVDTGDEGVNTHVVKTQEQYEKEISEGVNEIGKKYLSPKISEAIKQADDDWYNEMATPGVGEGSELAKLIRANRKADPEVVLSRLQKDVEAIYANKEFLADIEKKAAEAGIPREEYLEQVVKPTLEEQLASEFAGTMIAKSMPKSSVEYILQGMSNSIIGMLMSAVTETRSQREIRNQAEAMTESGDNPYYQPGTVASLAKMGVSFAADAPFFGIYGRVSASVVKRVAERQIQNMMARGLSESAARSIIGAALENSVGTRMKTYLMQHVISSSLTMGAYNATSEAARQVRDQEFDPARIATSTGEGLVTGAAFGVTGAFSQALTHPLTGIARVGAKIAGFGAEAETMYATEELAKMVHGEEGFTNPFEGSVEALMKLGVMKVSSPEGLRKVFNEVVHPVKSNKGQQIGMRFTKEEEAYVRSSSEGQSLLQALSKMHPELAVSEVGGKRTLTKDGEKMRRDLSDAYNSFMENADIPATVKMKVAQTLGGIYHPGLETGADIVHNADGSVLLKTRDKDGNCIREMRFDSFSDAENWRDQVAEEFRLNDAVNMFNGSPAEARANMLRELMNEYGVDAEQARQMIESALKGRMGTSFDNEQFQTIYDTIHRNAYPDDEYNPQRRYWEGRQLTIEERHIAQVDLQLAEERLALSGQAFADEVMGAAEYADEKIAELASRKDMTAEQIEAAMGYFNARARMEGMMDEVLQSVEDRVEAANAVVRKNTHPDSGSLIEAKADGRRYYVTAGHVALTQDGRIRTTDESGMVILRDAETGEIEVMNPHDVMVTAINDPQRIIEHNDSMDGLRGQLMKEADDSIELAPGTPEAPQSGDIFTGNDGIRYLVLEMTDAQGQPYWMKAPIDEEMQVGEPMPLDLEEYRKAKSDEIDAAETETVMPAGEAQMPAGEAQMPAGEAAGTMRPAGEAAGTAAVPLEGIRAEGNADGEAGVVNTGGNEPSASAPTSRIPVDERGRQLYEQARPEDTLAELTEKYGEQRAGEMVSKLAASTARAYDELSKTDTSGITDMADLAAHEDELTVARRKMEYWQGIEGIIRQERAKKTWENLVNPKEIRNFAEDSESQSRWVDEHFDEIVDSYIQTHGNILDPDELRKALTPIGYNGKNVPNFKAQQKRLTAAVYDKMLQDAVASGNTSITLLTGAGGAGKSTATKAMDFGSRGIVYDSAFNGINSLDAAIRQAKAAGMKDVQVVAVYNDATTSFLNTVDRGMRTGRFLALEYFVNDAFLENRGKIAELRQLHPDVEIVAFDNSGNKAAERPEGGRVSAKESENWDYTLNDAKLNELLDIFENGINEGRFTEDQIASIGRGLRDVTRQIPDVTPATESRVDRLGHRVLQQNVRDLRPGVPGEPVHGGRGDVVPAADGEVQRPSEERPAAGAPGASGQGPAAAPAVDAKAGGARGSGQQDPVRRPSVAVQGPAISQKQAKVYIGSVEANIGRTFTFTNQSGVRSELTIERIAYDGNAVIRRQDYDTQGRPTGEVREERYAATRVGEAITNGSWQKVKTNEENLREVMKNKVGANRVISTFNDNEIDTLWRLYQSGNREEFLSTYDDYRKAHFEDVIHLEQDERVASAERTIKYGTREEKIRRLRKLYQGDDEAILALSDESLQPQTLEEYVADLLGDVPKPSTGVLAYYSYGEGDSRVVGLQDETGFGNRGVTGDTKGFNPWLAPNGKGMSLTRYAEVLHEQLPEGIKEQNDVQAVRNAILDVLTSAEVPTDIPNMIIRDRMALAEEAMRREEQDWIDSGVRYQKKPRDFATRLQHGIEITNTKPSEAQKEAGNYQKGHVSFGGYDFTIENPAGSVRRGTDADGRPWERRMNNTYGYILGRYGKDGDHLDMFINDKADLDSWDGTVYVVDQVRPAGETSGHTEFDEHKVMYGFGSEEEARQAYLSNYEEGWQGLGAITGISKKQFDRWLDSSKRKMKPFAEHSIARERTEERIQGLDGYTKREVLDTVRSEIERILEDNGLEGIEIKGMDVHGSRMRGDARKDSDLDVVVEYSGDISEDGLFNILNDEGNRVYIGGIPVDINPITRGKSGTLEEYMQRSRAYDRHVRREAAAQRDKAIRDAVVDHLRSLGIEVSDDWQEGQRILDEYNGSGQIRQMGTTTRKRQESLSASFQGKELSEGQQTVVDAFTGKVPNAVLIVKDKKDKTRNITLKQGEDLKAGVKHSLFRHYGTNENFYNADEILFIPDVIANGVRSQSKNKIAYRLEKDGVTFTVTTLLKSNGGEVFTNYYTNREPIAGINDKSNTAKQHLPQQSDSDAKVRQNSETAKDSKEKIRQQKVDDGRTETIFNAAKNLFGTTRDIREAGYILPDGTMLDFSGRHEMDSGMDTSFLRGRRSVDHRDIKKIAYERDGNTQTGIETSMPDFIRRGAIRIDDGAGSINLSVKPTSKQKAALRQLIARNDGYVQVEFGDGWDSQHYVEYDEAKPAKVFADIDRYFDEGIKPGSSISYQKVAPVFVSNALRAVEGIKQEKATAEQWLAMIQKNGGLKAGEDKWLGLSEWLKDAAAKPQHTLTKQEVLDFIRENQIQIEEETYKELSDLEDNPQLAKFREEFSAFVEKYQKERNDVIAEADRFNQEMYEKYGSGWASDRGKLSAEERQRDADISKRYSFLNDNELEELAFGDMVEKYGDDFGMAFEVNHGNGKLDPQMDMYGEELSDAAVHFLQLSDRPINSTRLEYTTEGLRNKREIALTVPTIESWNESDEVHFGDAGEGRAVAWVRFGEKTDKDGKRVLVIDEVQSKRHQEGREKGYRGRTVLSPATMDDLEIDRSGDLVAVHYKPVNERFMFTHDKSDADILQAINETIAGGLMAEHLPRIPDAPFDKNWHELAMKRMLRYAAENGYDKVAWTKGEQQAERYNIGSVVDRIISYDYPATADREGRSSRKVEIRLKDGETMTMRVNSEGRVIEGRSDTEGKQLADIVGKDLAMRIMNGEGKDGTMYDANRDLPAKIISGDGLRIGGEGMKGFYDEILPRFMNKYGKKWGVKTGEIELSELGDGIAERSGKGLTMWSVDVTPDMKASVMEGQPMFFRTSDGEAYGYTLDGRIYIDPRIATSETPVHEYSHLWAEMKRQTAPEEWSEIKDIMLNDRLVKPIIDKVKSEYPELTAAGREDDFVEEIVTQFSGRRGAERLRKIADEVAAENGGVFGKAEAVTAMQRLKNILNRFWEGVAKMMGWKYRNANQIADRIMADMLNGVNPRENAVGEPKLQKKRGVRSLMEDDLFAGKTPREGELFGGDQESTAQVVRMVPGGEKRNRYALREDTDLGRSLTRIKQENPGAVAAYQEKNKDIVFMGIDAVSAKRYLGDLGISSKDGDVDVYRVPAVRSDAAYAKLVGEGQRVAVIDDTYVNQPENRLAQQRTGQQRTSQGLPENIVRMEEGRVSRDADFLSHQIATQKDFISKLEKQVPEEERLYNTWQDAIGKEGEDKAEKAYENYYAEHEDVIRALEAARMQLEDLEAELRSKSRAPEVSSARTVSIGGKSVDLKKMSDEELLDGMSTNSSRDRDFFIDEYDERHRQEYGQEVDRYSEMLERENTSLDDAYDMYANVSKEWNDGGFKSPERTRLMAQIDALEDYVERLEAEKHDRELEEEFSQNDRPENRPAQQQENRPEMRPARRQEESGTTDERAKAYEEQKTEVRAHGYDLTQLKMRELKKDETCHVERRYVENHGFSFTGGERVESAEDVAYIFRQLEESAMENTFMVMVKDGVPTVVHLGIGSSNMAPAPLENAFVAAQAVNPDKIWFLHNHPSGNLTASRPDREIQKKMETIFPGKAQPGIIINTTSGKYGEFTSESENKISQRPDKVEGEEIPVRVFNFSKQVFEEGWNPEAALQAVSSQGVAAFVSSHRLGKHKKMSLLVLDQAGHITGNVFLPWTHIGEAAKGSNAQQIATYVEQMGGTMCIIYGNYEAGTDYAGMTTDRAINGLRTELKGRNITLRDALNIDRSAYEWGVMEPETPYQGATEAHDNSTEAYLREYETALAKWKARNGLAPDAQAPTERPIYQQGESAVDYAKRVAQDYRERHLWQTAPKLDDYRQKQMDKDILDDARQEEQHLPLSQGAKMRRVAAELQRLRHATGQQKAYDKATVKAVTDFAQDFMRMGFGDNLGRGDIERMLSSVKNATGARSVKEHIDNILDILTDNYLRNLENRIQKLSSVKELKQTAQGVEVQGKLELKGQRMIQAFREARQQRMSIEDIRERMAEVSEKMTRNDEEAPMWEQEYEGLFIALQYAENIEGSRSEWAGLDREYTDAVKEYKQSGRSYQAQQELLESLRQAMTENKIERIGLYGDIIGRLEGNISESMKGAREFAEQDKVRIRHIHDLANSDLAGKDMGAFRTNEDGTKATKGKPINFFLSPLATFEQMLRQFGGRNARGEGNLYNYYMRSWMEATDKAFVNEQKAKKELDEKAREVFGKDVKRWSDLYQIVRRLPTMKVSVADQGEVKTFTLTQGNLLYIYMAEKMTDGKMKLRKMGITEEDIAAIKDFLDPRLVQLGDWLQDEYLVSKRTEYNKVHERMFGAPMAAIDHYFPIKILGDARVQEQDVANMGDQDAVLPSTITGSIVKRRKNALPLDILGTDALSLAIEHIEDMEHWAAQAEFNRDLNTLLSYTTFRNKVKNLKTIYGSGDHLWELFKDTAKMAAGTYRPRVKPGSVDKTISNVAKGVTAAKINFRVYTAFKQILSAPAFLYDVDLGEFVKDSFNPYGSWKWAMENMPVFRKRWESRQVGDTRLMDDPTDWKMWKTNVVQMATRLGMSPNALVDGVTCAVGARAIYSSRYKKYRKMGASYEDARKRALQDAEIGYNLTQQSSEGAFVSAIQKDRTVAANMLSVFRNSSMSYTRQWVDAARNLRHRMEKGYRDDSIHFMTGQFMEQLGLDEAAAKKAAEQEYARAGRHEVAKLLNMMFGVTVAWNIGASLPYLLFGDDKHTKGEMMEDALIKGLVAGPTEGFAAGNLWSDLIGRTVANEQTRRTLRSEGLGAAVDAAIKQGGDYEINPLPLMADLQSMIKKMGYDKYAAAQDVFNICMQSAVGVNPQTFTDMWNACMDYGAPGWDGTKYSGDADNLARPKEIALFIMRLMNAPTSSWRNKYIDELQMNSDEAKTLTYEEMAKRYAHYKHWKDTPALGWLRGDEARAAKIEKIQKQFDNAVQERMDRLDDQELLSNFTRSTSQQERRMLGKIIAARVLGTDTDGNKPQQEWQRLYQAWRSYEDVRDAALLGKKKQEAKERGDDETVKAIKDIEADILKAKKDLVDGDKPGEEYMKEIRQLRREALEIAMKAETARSQ